MSKPSDGYVLKNFTIPANAVREITDFKFKNRIENESAAYRALVAAGYLALTGKPLALEPRRQGRTAR